MPPSTATTGQTIDLMGGNANDEKKSEQGVDSASDIDLEAKRKELDATRKKRGEAIRARFESMRQSELIQAVLDAQAERVTAYKEYDRCVSLCVCGCILFD